MKGAAERRAMPQSQAAGRLQKSPVTGGRPARICSGVHFTPHPAAALQPLMRALLDGRHDYQVPDA